MLMGLIKPDGGEIRVFGHAIRPGAPVLSRVGAFVEGAGFLPHLSGRENLELYWQATGRPAEDAHLDEALEIAGLGDALARAVRTYSQGMRQRLAIAQAMLGLPDLLILDEPTNGLDPPQIREMREVMIRYAAAGRTVIVSSHLLAEVEQTCTHLVVMDRGRLVQAGPVSEIIGSGDTLLVGTADTRGRAGRREGRRAAGRRLGRPHRRRPAGPPRRRRQRPAPGRRTRPAGGARGVGRPAPPPGRRLPHPDRRLRMSTLDRAGQQNRPGTPSPWSPTATARAAPCPCGSSWSASSSAAARWSWAASSPPCRSSCSSPSRSAASPAGGDNRVNLMDTATASGANFAAVNLFVSAGFLLVIPVALFCGDTVASEASWSSLRYLLAAPVPRARLLWSKLVVGLGLSLAAMVLLPVVALAVGTAAYGWGPLELPTGGALAAGTAAQRLVDRGRRTSSCPNWSPPGSRSGCPRRPTPPSARSAARSA